MLRAICQKMFVRERTEVLLKNHVRLLVRVVDRGFDKKNLIEKISSTKVWEQNSQRRARDLLARAGPQHSFREERRH